MRTLKSVCWQLSPMTVKRDRQFLKFVFKAPLFNSCKLPDTLPDKLNKYTQFG